MLDAELQKHVPDMGAIKAYCRKDAEYCERVRELEAVTGERDQV